MDSLRSDIVVTRKALDRLVDALTGEPVERPMIAAKAAFEFITIDQGIDAAVRTFEAILADPLRSEVSYYPGELGDVR